MSLRLALVVVALAVSLGVVPAEAQSYVAPRSGPFVSIDLFGSPFQIGLERKVAGGAVGYRFGPGVDVAVLIEHASARPDTLFDIVGKTLVGAGAGLTFGPARSPWRLDVAAGAAWEGRSDLVFFDAGGSEYRGGARAAGLHAAASAQRYLRISDGPVRVLFGAGAFADVRRLSPRTTVYGAGGPDEVVRDNDAITEWATGAVLSAPISVRVWQGADLTVEPAVRLDLASLGLESDPVVVVRLNL